MTMIPVKNGFGPLKIEPLKGVIFEQPTWAFKNNALERVLNSANLYLAINSVFFLVVLIWNWQLFQYLYWLQQHQKFNQFIT